MKRRMADMLMPGYSVGNLGELVAAADTNPAGFPVPGCKTFSITVWGTFVGTVKVQGSALEKPDVTNADHWFDLIPVPAITITGIEIDGFSRDIDRFINYNRIGAPFDDRFNAKIISKYIEWPDYGLQNIKITGDFGFVENYTTYDTPLEIKEAVR